MKRYLIIAFLCLTAIGTQAQKITVNKTTIDVGKTGFEVPITGTFELRNKSSKTLIIHDVKADCGCTKVDRPMKHIGPNERFTISVTYDAKMLGHFTKQVAIYSNATEKPVYLKIKGVVLEELQDYSAKYPYNMDGLLTDVNNLEFDDVKKGDHPETVINLLNNTSGIVTPNMLHLPSYLSVISFPEVLSPGRAGKMTITLNSEKVTNYGLTQANIYLAQRLGETIKNDIMIPVSVVLLPDMTIFDGVNKQYAPHMEFSTQSLDLGQHHGRNIKSGTIIITNKGRTALKISSLQMFTAGLNVTLDKRELQPGEQAKLKVKGNRTQLLKARTKPRILMITNDPDHAKEVITINVK